MYDIAHTILFVRAVIATIVIPFVPWPPGAMCQQPYCIVLGPLVPANGGLISSGSPERTKAHLAQASKP